MSRNPHHHEDPQDPESLSQARKRFWGVLIGCIGVVYGDIGTSPLYAFREAMHKIVDHSLTPVEVYGILSLIIWSLMVVVTLKYVFFLLRADNKNEGGILALMSLVRKSLTSLRNRNIVMLIGVAGASLFYADAAITPAISVMSAVEGLKQVTPVFEHYTLGLSILILCPLFFFQKHGTMKVSAFFGPVTALWFLVLAAMGIHWIIKHPEILFCLSPHYGVIFILTHGWVSFMVMGAVFLAVTGAEALYADMGHFGVKPIQKAWLYFVFPALVLNYMGQGALVLHDPAAIENPFFLMVPRWALLPLVGLATIATIVAAQAVITGAYSVTQQAIQLGLLPRMEIRYTSEQNIGQIYMPRVNYLLLYAVLFFCILFQNSSSLASAYGIAVCGTMVITSVLAFFVVWKTWKKSLWLSLAIILPFFCIEIAFLSANLLRLFDGGFVPVVLGIYLSLLMAIWIYGSRYLSKKASRNAVRITDFSEHLDQNPPHMVKGTAIFFTSDPLTAPDAMVKNIQYNQIIHEHNIILTVVTSSFPAVEDIQRLHIERISSKLTRMIVHFGFMETPDVPRALSLARRQGFAIDLQNATYFLARRKIVSNPNRGLTRWQDRLYIGLTRFAIGEHDFYKLPRARVVELGIQIAI